MPKLMCSDGELEASIGALKLAKVTKLMLEDEDEDATLPLPLPDVNRKTMMKVLEFLEHHTKHAMPEIARPLRDANIAVWLKDFEWDKKYVDDMEDAELFDVTLAAKYLDCDPLLDLCAAKIASMIKGKTPQEIRKVFAIPEPTPEQEQKLKEQNAWIWGILPAGARVDAPGGN
jgi:S-phase kinase-associated protein 1